jgi:hypothetical protein
MIRRITIWLAQRQGYELCYPERADPPLEPEGTRANDGTPCAMPSTRPTTYRRGKL